MGPEELLIDLISKSRRYSIEDLIFDRIRALSDRDFDNFIEKLKTWGILTYDDIQKINKGN